MHKLSLTGSLQITNGEQAELIGPKTKRLERRRGGDGGRHAGCSINSGLPSRGRPLLQLMLLAAHGANEGEFTQQGVKLQNGLILHLVEV